MARSGWLKELLDSERNPTIARGLRFLAGLGDFAPECELDGAPHKIAIEGEDIFALVQSYHTKTVAEASFEVHRKYADLQYLVSGREVIRTAPLKGRKLLKAFEEGGDAAFYEFGEGTDHTLSVGMVAIILPGELHAPCLAVLERELVVKVVVKVAV